METESFTSKGVVEDTRLGLTDDPKWLSSLYFYDAAGSELFEQICETPEYYPTRTERAILEAHVDEILDAAGANEPGFVLAELGSGSSSKTRVILEALLKHRAQGTYLPVDVSAEFLAGIATTLEGDFPGLRVEPIAAEYKAGLVRIGKRPASRRCVLFLGSSIGNFEPDEQVALLREARRTLRSGDTFVLGTDLVKDVATLEAAYDDAAGVTAAFNRNILINLNAQLDGDADPLAFRHVALWNPGHSRIEMHLEAKKDMVLHFAKAELTIPVAAGERIHTENSYKFTADRIRLLCATAGFNLETTWTDPDGWFGLHLLRVP